MRFEPCPLPGAFVIELEPHRDERGFFSRAYCDGEFGAHGLHTDWPQCNVSFNTSAGTMRGIHWQDAPYAEIKLVRCTSGAVYDVIVDLRPDSPTRLEHFGVELTAENRKQLYVPEGFGHAFLTLEDHSEIFYQFGSSFVPGRDRGARYNDPAFGIEWPRDVAVISRRDETYPDYEEA